MPASRDYEIDDEYPVTVSVSGDLEKSWALHRKTKNIYFMDQSPEFEILISNPTDEYFEATFTFRISYSEAASEEETVQIKRVSFELDPGERHTETFSPEYLLHQGTAGIDVREMRISKIKGGPTIEKKTSQKYHRIYSFMVYDRDYYRVNYVMPRVAQYLAVLLSILIVATAIIQIYSLQLA
ncbi:hypothetical protein DJ71_25025 [Halorubrum sp. E3]|nr:hypothetical protein DJ71_25025 [Halorubrum sp. E3]